MKKNPAIDLDDIIGEYRKQKEKLAKKISEMISGFFLDREKVEAVRWTQYTPYFNDGDPCVFHVYNITVQFEKEGEFFEDYDKGDLSKAEGAIIDSLQKALDAIPEEIMLCLFGDHAQVTVFRGGYEVERYNHD